MSLTEKRLSSLISVDEITSIISASGTMLGAIGGTFVAVKLIRTGNSTHRMVNQQHDDNAQFTSDLIDTLNQNNVTVPKDKSLDKSGELRQMTAVVVMPDTIGSTVNNLPTNFPVVAGYVTGSGGVAWSTANWARFPNSGHFRIDQSPNLTAFMNGGADCADVEFEAATPQGALDACMVREKKGWYSWIYISATNGNLQAFRAMVAKVRLKKVRYWVANPNFNEAEAVAFLDANPDTDAVQWATPTTNPDTILPGTTMGLKAANADLSVARVGWFNKAKSTPAKLEGMVITPTLSAFRVTSTDGGQSWHRSLVTLGPIPSPLSM